MFAKLALRNVRKSFQNYVIYFVTLIIAVCLFFTFNTFKSQGIMDGGRMSDMMKSAESAMTILTLFVALVLGFLICYANIFMMKKRSKEMATYMLLGMRKQKMSLILTMEVLIVGFLALFIGIILGIFASQFLMTYTSNILVGSVSYHFIFSVPAFLTTIGSFALLFLVVIIVSLFTINRLRLIDLIHADKKVGKAPIQNVGVASVVCLIALIGFAITYYLGMQNLVANMILVLLIGGVSTIIFFLSLSGFIVALSSKFKKMYYKNLNMYSIRQINANVGSNFLSMSMVCLMVLVSMMALSVSFSVNGLMDEDMKDLDMGGDARIITQYQSPLDTAQERLSVAQLQYDFVSELKTSEYVKDFATIDMFFIAHTSKDFGNEPVVLLEDLNSWRSLKGLEPIQLSENEAAFIPNKWDNVDDEGNESTVVGEDTSSGTISILDQEYQVVERNANTMMEFQMISTGEGYYLVDIPRPNLETLDIDGSEYRFSMYSGTTFILNDPQKVLEFEDWSEELYKENYESRYCEVFPESVECGESGFIYSKPYELTSQAALEMYAMGNKIIFTFMGLYLGIVFIVCSAVVLAIQLISHATAQKEQYQILSKIGASQKQIRNTVVTQCATYFLIPLSLAIIHSIFGLKSFANLFPSSQGTALFLQSAIPMGIVLIVVYSIYFLITVVSYGKIIKKK